MMYIIQNSLKNLSRNKGRNLLIGSIFLITIIATVIAIIIHTTTSSMIDDYKTRFGAEAKIITDDNAVEKLMQEEMNKNKGNTFSFEYEPPEITSEEYALYGKSKYVKDINIVSFVGYSGQLKSVQSDLNDETANDIDISQKSREELLELFGDEQTVNEFLNEAQKYREILGEIKGYSNWDLMEEFNNGERKITSGDIFSKEKECVISEKFAKLNNLKVGDTFEISDMMTSNNHKLSLTITGIYRDLGKNNPNSVNNRHNDILVSFDTLSKSAFSDINTEATYYLINPEVTKDFLKEIKDKGLPETMTLATDTATYNSIVEPVKNLTQVSMSFLIAVLSVGSVIIVFLSIISIRERKYEIGVLRAIGMKKINMAKGLIYESLIIVVLSLSVGLFVGERLAQPISHYLLENQIQAATQEKDYGNLTTTNELQTNDETNNSLLNIEAKLSTNATINIVIVSISLGLLSSLVGILYITQYEPMKILSEQN